MDPSQGAHGSSPRSGSEVLMPPGSGARSQPTRRDAGTWRLNAWRRGVGRNPMEVADFLGDFVAWIG